jgi:hypothetical protein
MSRDNESRLMRALTGLLVRLTALREISRRLERSQPPPDTVDTGRTCCATSAHAADTAVRRPFASGSETGDKVVPSSWRKPPTSGPMLVAGDIPTRWDALRRDGIGCRRNACSSHIFWYWLGRGGRYPGGFRSWCPQGRAGSNPVSRTAPGQRNTVIRCLRGAGRTRDLRRASDLRPAPRFSTT